MGHLSLTCDLNPTPVRRGPSESRHGQRGKSTALEPAYYHKEVPTRASAPQDLRRDRVESADRIEKLRADPPGDRVGLDQVKIPRGSSVALVFRRSGRRRPQSRSKARACFVWFLRSPESISPQVGRPRRRWADVFAANLKEALCCRLLALSRRATRTSG